MSEKDVHISYAQDCGPLLEVLAGARRPGNYFSSGTVETPMPSIEVEGHGMLSFPVPPSQARDLMASAAERAPYGRGDRTLVDESVRNVWQIPPSKLKLGGKGWAASLDELVRRIGEDLGCEGVEVAAELYKLLIYKKGSFFLSHRDSEKSGGMFGTLVVTLPSLHEGGDLVIRHAGRETTLDLRGGAPSEIRYAAFYADCEHEVKPVRSGHRVCLIYNLVQKKKTKLLLPPDHRDAISAAAPLLRKWAFGGGQPDKIVHLLDHHYTEAALSFSALKGADASLAQVLVPAAAQAGCAVHLGLVHIEESGWAEHTGGGFHGRRHRRSHWHDEDEEEDEAEFEVGEVCDGSYHIDHWHAPDDAPADFGEIPIGDGEILPPGALDDEPPDDSHFSEATGNEGASFERTYLRAALVIWPEHRFDRICASAGPDAALARLEQLVTAAKKSTPKNRPPAEDAVRQMARALPPLDEHGHEKADRLTRLLAALNRFGDPALLLETAEPALLDLYDGAQNDALIESISVLGEKRAAALLTAVVEARGEYLPAAILQLWTALAKDRTAGKSRPLLTRVLTALLGAIARHTPPERPAWTQWGRHRHLELDDADEFAGVRGPRPLTPATASTFLEALHSSPCAGQMPEAVRAIMEKPALFSPEKVLLPALEEIGKSIAPPEGPADLWAHCARHYLHRSERPPEPPRDWAQQAELAGKSPLIRELAAFARDPHEQVHRFRVRQELRHEIHQAIDRAGLDMKHVTERTGSPHTLVCTKTRATYERACKQYRGDLAGMRRLLALPSAKVESGAPLSQRLRQAAPVSAGSDK